jgi:GTP-binding protein
VIDQVKITVQGGHGGAGAVSFLRRKGVPKTPPDGGRGGDGGNLYLLATTDQNTLLNFRFQKIFRASVGGKGGVANRYGRAGQDLVLNVPVGTQIYWLDRLVRDLDRPGLKVLIAKGGAGGRGNAQLKTKYDRLPHRSEPGEEGEVKEIRLELKLIADIGIVGLPNAGKSTLLSKLTAAQPKIGAYPFTTLEPNLGVMDWKGQSLVLADIPGLIEGAAEGKGLGYEFLRHVERTKLLLHLTASWADYQLIRNEIFIYSKELVKKKELVVVSQADKYSDEELRTILKELKSHHLKPVVVSALTGQGLDELRDAVAASLPD